jgi:Aminoarabinose transferase C-terminal domain/Dolichyl-phosphate-mannose-protein mannosyltransferase
MPTSPPYSAIPKEPSSPGKLWFWLAALVVVALWFSTLGTRHLLNPDEGRYAEIAREMLVTGDWVTPRLNGIKYFEKPPLQYWMTAVAYQTFGLNEFAARFWTGLTGAAGILLAGFAGMRLFGRSAGLMAAAIAASSLLYLVIGHVNTLDMGLSFFLELTVCGFLIAQRSAPASADERNWMLLAWAGAALAFLSKGLIALVLPSLTLLAYTALTREYSAWKRLHIVKGLALFLLLALPWLVAAARINPEFMRFFFLHEQFERFLVDSHDRDGPWWYFLPFFALGSLPWTFVALRQFTPAWRLDGQVQGLQTRRFLMLWVAVVIGFFSLSHSKLAPYIVPAMPIFAIALGDIFTRLPIKALRMHLLVIGIALALLGLAVAVVSDHIAGAKSADVVRDLRPETTMGFLLTAAAMLGPCWFWRHQSVEKAVLATAFGTLLGLSVLLYGAEALSSTRSGYTLSQHIAPLLRPSTRLFSVSGYDQTLPFYLQRRMTLVNYRGELDFGLSQEPELAIDTIEAFVRIWRNESDAIAVMPPALYNELLNQGLPMQLITRQAKLVAIRKP